MEKRDRVYVKIIKQGAPLINGGSVVEYSKNIAAVNIDLHSKYCVISSSICGSDGTVGMLITADERSLHLKENVDKNEPTHIEFPQFKGWEVYSADIGRYCLNICFIKKQ